MLFFTESQRKNAIAAISLLAVTFSAFAVRIAPFTSWEDLTKKSPDIIIAQCITTPESVVIINGMNWSNIEVISVLKGDTKAGVACMVWEYGPCQGEQVFIF